MKKFIAVIISITILLTFSTLGQAAERRRPTKKGTALKIGAGAAVGAGLGALLGGGKGAAAGAAIGGGAMTYQSLARRDSGYGRNTRKTGTIIAGTAVGAGIGAAIGGGKGAGIGALVGGGASAIYAFTRKDLKKPSYQETYSSNRQRQSQTYQQNPGAYQNNTNGPDYQNAYLTSPRPIDNNDPYQRMAGPQGAGVGRLLSNGSTSIY